MNHRCELFGRSNCAVHDTRICIHHTAIALQCDSFVRSAFFFLLGRGLNNKTDGYWIDAPFRGKMKLLSDFELNEVKYMSRVEKGHSIYPFTLNTSRVTEN